MENNTLLKNKEEWEKFTHADVMNFMAVHNLQKIIVDDGSGKKATIRRGAQGEFKIQIVSQETL